MQLAAEKIDINVMQIRFDDSNMQRSNEPNETSGSAREGLRALLASRLSVAAREQDTPEASLSARFFFFVALFFFSSQYLYILYCLKF
jgi:hypothetical protein